jgi:hypothetical protein
MIERDDEEAERELIDSDTTTSVQERMWVARSG